MKKFIAVLTLGLFFIACTDKVEPKENEQADYAETHEELIQNPAKDSAALKDTINARQNMPPQTQEKPETAN